MVLVGQPDHAGHGSPSVPALPVDQHIHGRGTRGERHHPVAVWIHRVSLDRTVVCVGEQGIRTPARDGVDLDLDAGGDAPSLLIPDLELVVAGIYRGRRGPEKRQRTDQCQDSLHRLSFARLAPPPDGTRFRRTLGSGIVPLRPRLLRRQALRLGLVDQLLAALEPAPGRDLLRARWRGTLDLLASGADDPAVPLLQGLGLLAFVILLVSHVVSFRRHALSALRFASTPRTASRPRRMPPSPHPPPPPSAGSCGSGPSSCTSA